MQLTHPSARRVTTIVVALLLVATTVRAQERPGIPITFDLAAIYTDAFGGAGGGFQITVSTPLPISLLGAHYTAGAQFWYSQTRIVGGSIEDSQRQLTGIGGHVTAAWNVSNTVFPYLRLPVQGVRSEIAGTQSAGQTIPVQNQAGTATSFAFGIAGGAMVQLGSAFSAYGGFSTLAQRLYDVNHTPIWSLELGIGVAPAAFRKR
ncbi:MAG: hypothetical protein JSW51_10345 [Gemmatimonadota bacterium]|nr:MAG: hypothetical protein JSW51_10345 [Gemmatimonadota bacterium]